MFRFLFVRMHKNATKKRFLIFGWTFSRRLCLRESFCLCLAAVHDERWRNHIDNKENPFLLSSNFVSFSPLRCRQTVANAVRIRFHWKVIKLPPTGEQTTIVSRFFTEFSLRIFLFLFFVSDFCFFFFCLQHRTDVHEDAADRHTLASRR